MDLTSSSVKERVSMDQSVNNMRIKEMQFCIMSPEEIMRYSEMEVHDNVLYDVSCERTQPTHSEFLSLHTRRLRCLWPHRLCDDARPYSC